MLLSIAFWTIYPASLTPLLLFCFPSLFHFLSYLSQVPQVQGIAVLSPYFAMLPMYTNQVLSFCASFEVFVLLQLVLDKFFSDHGGSVAMILIHFQFLLHRYRTSMYTRMLVHQVKWQLQQLRAHPSCPSFLRA